jgi:hypothetical protein
VHVIEEPLLRRDRAGACAHRSLDLPVRGLEVGPTSSELLKQRSNGAGGNSRSVPGAKLACVISEVVEAVQLAA